MSHPNPSHEHENEYPEDKVTHFRHSKLKKPLKFKRTQLAAKVGSWAKALKSKQH